jgi:hypothetical protein
MGQLPGQVHTWERATAGQSPSGLLAAGDALNGPTANSHGEAMNDNPGNHYMFGPYPITNPVEHSVGYCTLGSTGRVFGVTVCPI